MFDHSILIDPLPSSLKELNSPTLIRLVELETVIVKIEDKIEKLYTYRRDAIAPEHRPLLREFAAANHESVEAETEAEGDPEFVRLWAKSEEFSKASTDDWETKKLAEEEHTKAEVRGDAESKEWYSNASIVLTTITAFDAAISNDFYDAALARAPRLKAALVHLRELKAEKGPRLAELDADFERVQAEIKRLTAQRDVLKAEMDALEVIYNKELAAEAEAEAKMKEAASPPTTAVAAAAVAARPLPVAASAGTPSTLMPTMAIASTAAAARPAPANTNISPGVKQAALASPAKDGCIIM